MKRWQKAVGVFVAAFVVFLLAVYGNHRICLKKESELLVPLGDLVEVEGHNMSVYSSGDGEKTMVFLSGGGTCSPILDFKSLYSLLEEDYTVVVVEKFGYGFSDVVNEQRNLDVILRQTRTALQQAGHEGPYVLCPHSMSGIEALYWAQQYPEEIEAIIGLDMAVPQYYESMDISLFAIRLGKCAADLGVTRLIPGLSESDAIQHGTLTEEEKELYRALFYRRTATVTMIREAQAIYENARMVQEREVPQVPILLFLSDGSGGTGFDTETWRSIPKDYLAQVENGSYIELDCPHYVHDYEYERISDEIRAFLEQL